jgi:predicted nucleic acid-binding protein
MTKEIVVLDTCCFFCLIQGEPGSDFVEELLNKAKQQKIALYMSVINYCEILYQIKRSNSYLYERALLDSLPIEVVDANKQITEIASNIKSRGKISLGDSYAIATAIHLGGSVATSDHHEFQPFEKDVKITWIR